MSIPRSGGGSSFGAFLKTVGRDSPGQSSAQHLASSAPRRVLRELVDSGPEPVGQLLSTLHIDVVEFGQALRTMREAGLVETHGSGADEIVELTSMGRQLASIDFATEK